MKLKVKVLFGVILVCLLLAACSMANNPVYKTTKANVGDGIWHGLTAGFIMLYDTFFKVNNPQLYAANNVGYWYNAGFFCIAPLIAYGLLGILALIVKSASE